MIRAHHGLLKLKWGGRQDEKGSSEGGQLFHGLLVQLESEQRRVIRSQEEEGERMEKDGIGNLAKKGLLVVRRHLTYRQPQKIEAHLCLFKIISEVDFLFYFEP